MMDAAAGRDVAVCGGNIRMAQTLCDGRRIVALDVTEVEGVGSAKHVHGYLRLADPGEGSVFFYHLIQGGGGHAVTFCTGAATAAAIGNNERVCCPGRLIDPDGEPYSERFGRDLPKIQAAGFLKFTDNLNVEALTFIDDVLEGEADNLTDAKAAEGGEDDHYGVAEPLVCTHRNDGKDTEDLLFRKALHKFTANFWKGNLRCRVLSDDAFIEEILEKLPEGDEFREASLVCVALIKKVLQICLYILAGDVGIIERALPGYRPLTKSMNVRAIDLDTFLGKGPENPEITFETMNVIG